MLGLDYILSMMNLKYGVRSDYLKKWNTFSEIVFTLAANQIFYACCGEEMT